MWIARSSTRILSRRTQLADALGRQRHLAHAHAEGRERVLDRLSHERRHRNRARLTHALDAERIEGREGLEVYDVDGWHLGRRRDVELHERPRERLSGRVEA